MHSVLVLFSDKKRAICHKPPGMTVDQFKAQIPLVLQQEKDARDPGWVPSYTHRLDRLTSGCLTVALTREEARRLSGLFRERQVDKTYFALVKGEVTRNNGTIDLPLDYVLDERTGLHISRPSATGSRPSKSGYTVIARSPHVTLLQLKPETGRMHQLRVHCASIGHPIIGDPLYNGGAKPPLCLHARHIVFKDENANPITATAPLPHYMVARVKKIWGERLLQKLGVAQ